MLPEMESGSGFSGRVRAQVDVRVRDLGQIVYNFLIESRLSFGR